MTNTESILNSAIVENCLGPESSATGMGQFSICELKWDFLRTSVRACTIDEIIFSAPFGIFYMKTEIGKQILQKTPVQPPNGVLPISKLPFTNHPSVEKDLCLKIEVRDQTIWKSTPEL